ncbi:rubredoxin [Archaeoglobales archaeon]|nr:MAG: rubredoxin [Archaeoglobales archaeon ex4484_92]RLI81191.1 MAG: rubredoxin [Archaeoglobales archaeon]
MTKWQCTNCGYIYDEREGDPSSDILPNTKWVELPNNWSCPVCGARKQEFERLE